MTLPERTCVFCGTAIRNDNPARYLQGLPLVTSACLLVGGDVLTPVCAECALSLDELDAALYGSARGNAPHTPAATSPRSPEAPQLGCLRVIPMSQRFAALVEESDALVRNMRGHKRLRDKRRFGVLRHNAKHPWAGMPVHKPVPPPKPGPAWAILWRRSLDLLEWVPFWITIESGMLNLLDGRFPYDRIRLDRRLLERWEVSALLEETFQTTNDRVSDDPTFAACITRDPFSRKLYFDAEELMAWLVEQYADEYLEVA